MIHAFDLYSYFVHVFMFMFSFMYMSILSKLLTIHIHPLSHLPSCIYFGGLVYIWICMYTLVCAWHTYTLKIKSFWWFSCFKEFLIELNCLFSWLCFSHKTCTLTLFEVFSWFCFHESYMSFYLLSVNCWVIFMFHGIYFCFIPYLKDSVLVYKLFI